LHGPAKSAARKRMLCMRALNDLDAWIRAELPHAAE
jgi:hypothetical protein